MFLVPEGVDQSPLISLVIPCFNDGDYLVEAVASLDERIPVERVIIDDGSTDPATLELLDQLESDGWRVVHQENRKLAGAVQRGIDETTAPYFFRLDADDLLSVGALEQLVGALEQHPEAGFAFGDFKFFGAQDGIWRAPPFDPWMVMYGNFWSPSVCFRRTTLELVGGYRQGWYYEDWNMYMRLAQHNVRGVHAGCITYNRRLLEGRMQAQHRARHREIYREMRREHAAFFSRKDEFLRASSPPAWKRIAYPLFLGPRYALPEPLYRLAVRSKLALGRARRDSAGR
jgi:glycosyltransferase involved in cell wall biosynthesis